MTPQRFKDETLRVLVDIVEAGARREATLLLFEDLHWADPTTLEALDLLIARMRDVPLLAVLTHRPEFQSRWGGHSHVTTLSPTKLSRGQSSAMVLRVASGKALPPELLQQIIAKTDGVPLFVEEITRAILESGDLKEIGDRYDYAGNAGSITVPATLKDSLMARLDQHPAVKQIAQIGAAIGREFSYELIAAVAPGHELDAGLAQLIVSGLVFRRGSPPEAIYTFKHALVQDTAYESMLKSRRAQIHGQIAAALETHFPYTPDTEPERLARHYTEAGDAAKAVPYWLKAGELARARSAMMDSIAFFEQGLKLVQALPPNTERDSQQLDLRIGIAFNWMALYGWATPKAREYLDPALPLAQSSGSIDQMAAVLAGLWVQQQTCGEARQALRWASMMFEEAERRGGEVLRLVGHWAHASAQLFLGEFKRCMQHADELVALYDAERHGHLVKIVNNDLKTPLVFKAQAQWILGYPNSAVRTMAELVDHCRHIGAPVGLGFVLYFDDWLCGLRGEPARMLIDIEEYEQIGRDQRLPFLDWIIAPIHRAWALLELGKPHEAWSQFQETMPRWIGAGGEVTNTFWLSLQARAALESGHHREALELLEAVLDQARRPGWEERAYLAEALRIKGLALQVLNDPAGAEACFNESLEVARSQQAKSWELRTATTYARLLRAQDRATEALELLWPVYDWFTEGFDTKDWQEAKALLDELQA